MRQDEDGRPHFSYFSEGHAFTWAGDLREEIEVAYGGTGEPVTDTISLKGKAFIGSPGIQLDFFKRICDRWLEAEGRQ